MATNNENKGATMNPLTPVDPPEVIETNECPRCDSILTEVDSDWICGDDGGAEYFVKCPCGFRGPSRDTKQDAADVFNELTEDDLLEDCEHCSDERYDMSIVHRASDSGHRAMFKATCECGASGSWGSDKGEVIDRHNELMETIRG